MWVLLLMRLLLLLLRHHTERQRADPQHWLAPHPFFSTHHYTQSVVPHKACRFTAHPHLLISAPDLQAGAAALEFILAQDALAEGHTSQAEARVLLLGQGAVATGTVGSRLGVFLRSLVRH